MKNNLKILLVLFITSSKLFCLIPYISPGVSIGINNSELYISSQLSLGISFLDDHYDDYDNVIDYFVPSVSLGIKYFPQKKEGRLFRYTDIQSTTGFIGIGRGIVKGIDNDYYSVKNKFFIGYLILYNYEKELKNNFKDHSLKFVLPIPFYELY